MAREPKTRELAAAFREAGIPHTEALADHVRIQLTDVDLHVRPVNAGHGRPQEVQDALARAATETRPNVAATVVADHFTTGAVELLREAGANYLDDCRFVFRYARPFVAIDRTRVCDKKATQMRTPGLGGKIGTAVQQMLLTDVEWWRVTGLAQAADVAPGTAQAALKRLEDLDLAEAEGVGPNKWRRLRDRGAVLEEWVRYARAERNVLLTSFVMSQNPVERATEVSKLLGRQTIEHAVTGACAGLLLAPHVTDVRTCEVWVDPALSAGTIADALGGEPVTAGGNVIILQGKTSAPLFASREVKGAMVANPLRVYADLLEDPRRGEEQAAFLRETVLGF
ncbi:MAG: hypothetical protein ACYC77_09230 [Coriobacteriia bacterium]